MPVPFFIRASACRLALPSLLAIGFTCYAFADAPAAAPTDRDRLLTAKPLASAPVHVVKSAAPAAGPYDPTAAMAAAPASPPQYAPAPRSDWRAGRVDRGDPWLRVLLLAPSRPVIIDVAVFMDAKPFREAEEAALDALAAPPAAAKPSPDPAANSATDEPEGEVVSLTGGDSATSGIIDPDEALKEKLKAKKEAPEEKTVSRDAESSERSASAEPEKPAANDSKKEPPAKSDDKSKKEKAEKKPAKKPKDAPPTTKAEARTSPSLAARLADFAAASSRTATREEIRWLLEQWSAAPAPRLLGEDFAWQRAAAAPLLSVLDIDGGGTLSPDEIAAAQTSLDHADADEDEVVDLAEMQKFGADVVSRLPARTYPLATILDSGVDERTIERFLARAYGRSSPHSATGQGARAQTAPADLVLRVDLAANGAQISLMAAGGDLASVQTFADDRALAATDEDLTLEVEAYGGPDAGDAEWAPLFSIGAAMEGSPLLRLIDADADGRLTRRERKELSAALARLDRNQDGSLSANEIGSPIRLAFARGLAVDAPLSRTAPAVRQPSTAAEKTVKAPDWFAAMDLNGDGDLARGEFAGDGAQFAALDADKDGLLSAAEAAAAEQASP